MNQLYRILDKHPKMSLAEIGFLTLLLEQDELYFSNEESMLLYFRVKIYSELLDVIDPLVTCGVVIRDLEASKTVITVLGSGHRLVIDNKIYKTNLNDRLETYLLSFPKPIAEKLSEIFQHCSDQMALSGKTIDNYTIEKFFSAMQSVDARLMFHLYGEFKKIIHRKKMGFKYFFAVWDSIRNQHSSPKKTIQRRKDNTEKKFAIQVANGYAYKSNNIKYQLLLKQKKIDELKKYYNIGYELLEDKSQAYEGYSWYENS